MHPVLTTNSQPRWYPECALMRQRYMEEASQLHSCANQVFFSRCCGLRAPLSARQCILVWGPYLVSSSRFLCYGTQRLRLLINSQKLWKALEPFDATFIGLGGCVVQRFGQTVVQIKTTSLPFCRLPRAAPGHDRLHSALLCS